MTTGRKTPLRPGEPAREPLPLIFNPENQNRAAPQPTRVRTFPLRTTPALTSRKVPPRDAAGRAEAGKAFAAAQDHTTPATPAQTQPVETFAASGSDSFPHSGLQFVVRAGRLTWDATLLLVFSPVIAVWWLLERRHRKGGR